MAKQICTNCGTQFSIGEGWAKAAVSLLIPAPAVPDLATQVRCPHCQHVFAEIRHRDPPSKLSQILLILVLFVLVIWAVLQMF